VVISQAHKAADLASPTTSSLVSRTHAGIRRTLGTAQNGKAPARVDDLKRILERLPGTRVGLRDRALLLLGFAGAFRRSELVVQACSTTICTGQATNIDSRSRPAAHAHHLLGTFDAITSEPKDVVRSDAGVPVVPLLQEASQDMLVVLPARDEVGIFMHLVRRQLKGFGNACGIARAQRATAIDAHQLRSSPVDGNLLHTAQRFFA
jgi:hypothetical protein